MSRALTRLLLAVCVAATLNVSAITAAAAQANACAAASPNNPDAAPAAAGGMGGTGMNAGAGGMGGTGTVADVVPVVPGVPGSGGMGGTGILGVITGFASICVNGAEVHYDAQTPVSVNGRPGAARHLAVGQLVAVNAREVGGQLRANGIGVVDAIAGPVTRINAAARELQVMGQTVRTAGAAGADLSDLRVGANARVSGHRAENGDVIATRVDTVSPAGAASLHGTVTRVEADAILVDGTRVTLGGRGTRGIAAGSEVFVSGEWSGSALRAQRVDTQPLRNAIARSERALIEGYVRGKTSRQLNVGGINVRIDDRVRYNGGNDRDAVVGRKVQVEVRRSGNDWQAERVRLQRDDRGGRSGRDESTHRSGGEGAREAGDSGRSGSRESGRSDSRDAGRSDSRDSGRSDSRDSGRSDSRDSGRSDSGSGRGRR